MSSVLMGKFLIKVLNVYLNFRGINPSTRDPPPKSAIVKTLVLTTSILDILANTKISKYHNKYF